MTDEAIRDAKVVGLSDPYATMRVVVTGDSLRQSSKSYWLGVNQVQSEWVSETVSGRGRC